jgi:putative membrane protein
VAPVGSTAYAKSRKQRPACAVASIVHSLRRAASPDRTTEGNLMIKREEPAGASSSGVPDLGAMRTVMAADRTLMAWIRTSLSLFSFGYTIYKILQDVQEGEKILAHGATPRQAGVFLSLTGTVALVMGIAEYYGTLRLLRREHAFSMTRPSLLMSLVMVVIGVLLSGGIMTRLL